MSNVSAGLPAWAFLVVVAVLLLPAVMHAAIKLIPGSGEPVAADDSYGHVCRRGIHVDEADQWPHRAPDGSVLCCEQALVAWPHPCPWHTARQAVTS